MSSQALPTARSCFAPGLLASVYLCLCFAPLGARLPFTVPSLRLWTLAIVLLLASALATALRPWRHGCWLLALVVFGHCLGSPVLFSEITFHLLALSTGFLLVLAIVASQSGHPVEAMLWLVSGLLSWVYMQPHNLSDNDAWSAALSAYGAPLMGVSVAAQSALLTRFGHGLARTLNRAFLLALGLLLFTHLTGLLPLGNARQWLWLVAMSMVMDALVIAQLLATPGRMPRWLGWLLVALLACHLLMPSGDARYGYPGKDSLYQQVSALPASEILVQRWAQAAVARYRALDPGLARHRFVQAGSIDALFQARHTQAFYLLGAPLDLQHNTSGLDAGLQRQVDRYRCRYTWNAAISDGSVLHLSCG